MRKGHFILRALVVLSFSFVPYAGAQVNENVYAFHDTYGRIVYQVPEVIVKKTMDVTLSSVPPSPLTKPIAGTSYAIQVGTFAVKENAYRLKDKLRADGYSVEIRKYFSRYNGLFYVVFAGSFVSPHEAKEKMQAIRTAYSLNGLLRARNLGKG